MASTSSTRYTPGKHLSASIWAFRMFGARRTSSPVFVDISGFPVIKIVLASIDALVEKEVIPEVSEDLSCTKGACDLASALFLSPAAFSVNAINRQCD